MQIDMTEIRDALIAQLVAKFDETEDLTETVKCAVRERANEFVTKEIQTEMREYVRAIIAAVLSEPVQMTTKWGEPVGTPKTMREHLSDAVKDVMRTRCDSNGRVGEYRADDIKDTVVGYIARTIAESVVKAEFSAHLAAAVAMAKAEIAALVVKRTQEIAERAAKGTL